MIYLIVLIEHQVVMYRQMDGQSGACLWSQLSFYENST